MSWSVSFRGEQLGEQAGGVGGRADLQADLAPGQVESEVEEGAVLLFRGGQLCSG